jgi:hypothetical protein
MTEPKPHGKTEIEFVKIVFRINYLENEYFHCFTTIFCQQYMVDSSGYYIATDVSRKEYSKMRLLKPTALKGGMNR